MVDAILLIIVVVSVVVGVFRGFSREIVSLLTWVFALCVTVLYSRQFSTLLPSDTIESLPARLAVSAVALMIGCLLIGALINFLFAKITSNNKVGWMNRISGVFFGLARGICINTALVLGGHLFPGMQQELWWRESHLLPYFDRAAAAVHQRLPSELSNYFDFK